MLEAVPMEVQKYLAEVYKKVSFGRKPTNISQYGGSIFVSFSKNETYRFNIGLYKNEVTLDKALLLTVDNIGRRGLH